MIYTTLLLYTFYFILSTLLGGVLPMSVNEILMKNLRCPACLGNLELKPDGSALKCLECHRVYAIRDDIPIMLIDEAVIEEPEASSV